MAFVTWCQSSQGQRQTLSAPEEAAQAGEMSSAGLCSGLTSPASAWEQSGNKARAHAEPLEWLRSVSLFGFKTEDPNEES